GADRAGGAPARTPRARRGVSRSALQHLGALAGGIGAMNDPARHEISECALAWQTLRMAHDRVAQRLGSELAGACGLAINEFDVLLFLHSHPHEKVRIGALL